METREQRIRRSAWRQWGWKALIVAVLVWVCWPVLWLHIIGGFFERRQTWEGTLEKKWTRSSGGPAPTDTDYWQVTCDDGSSRTLMVPGSLSATVRVGDRLKKVRGERYPRVVRLIDRLNELQQQMGDKFPKELRPMVPAQR